MMQQTCAEALRSLDLIRLPHSGKLLTPEPRGVLQIENCWHLVEQRGAFQERRQAVASFNAGSRYRKRGLALIPTKFGIAFTAFFLNQVGRRGV